MEGRNQEQGNFPTHSTHLPRNLIAEHTWHFVVEHNQVDRFVTKNFKPRFSIQRNTNLVPRVA